VRRKLCSLDYQPQSPPHTTSLYRDLPAQ
jgi:hypothetical protein